MMRLKPRESKGPAQSWLLSHRTEQTTQDFQFQTQRSPHCAQQPPYSLHSPGEAGVLFSLAAGRADVRSDRPKVTQVLSGKAGIHTQHSPTLKLPVLVNDSAVVFEGLNHLLRTSNILTSIRGKKSSRFSACIHTRVHTSV